MLKSNRDCNIDSINIVVHNYYLDYSIFEIPMLKKRIEIIYRNKN